MAKTTKKARGIQSLIKFQRHQGIESLTIEGKEALADLTQDKHGDTTLILNADEDKINEIESTVPYLQAESVLSGGNHDKLRTAIISQDLTQFPLSGGELVTVTKTTEGLTLDDSKVKELVETKATELKKELGTGTGGTASPITLNGGELVKVDKSGDTLTLNDGKVKELVDTKTNQVKTELIGMLPQKVLIEKTGEINNAVLILPMRVEDTVGYISVICYFTDNTTALIDLSVPNGNYNFDKVEQGIYINWSISRESVALNLYFKKTVQSVETRTIVFGDLYEQPSMETNSLEGTYDSHITTGNTSQPLHYDEL